MSFIYKGTGQGSSELNVIMQNRMETLLGLAHDGQVKANFQGGEEASHDPKSPSNAMGMGTDPDEIIR